MIVSTQKNNSEEITQSKSPSAFRTISEVAKELNIPQHVLRFWENKFTLIKPMKRGGGRRYYRPEDVAILQRIQHLLYNDCYTIKGVQKILRKEVKKSNEVKSNLLHKERSALNSIVIELEEIRQSLS